MKKLMSVSVNTRINEKPPAPQLEGFTMFTMYQDKLPTGRYGEAVYEWHNFATWDEVVQWISSYPIGTPLVKQ